jgi:hypothetical protein
MSAGNPLDDSDQKPPPSTERSAPPPVAKFWRPATIVWSVPSATISTAGTAPLPADS